MSLRSPKPLELNPDTAQKELQKNESEMSIFSGLDKDKISRNPSQESLRKYPKVAPVAL